MSTEPLTTDPVVGGGRASRSRQRRDRLALGAALVAGYGLALAVIWLRPALTRQHQVVSTMIVTFVFAVLALAWLVAAAPIRARARAAAALGVLVAGALVAATVRIDGVTGDVRPILRLRWDAGPETFDERLGTPDPELFRSGDHDWPSFRGPARTGVAAATIGRDWETTPPVERWRREIGAGWGSFAIVGRVAITQEQRGGEEMVVAYSTIDGAPLWSHGDRTRYETTIGGIGPRATPTITGTRVFTMGATGVVNALDLYTGDLLWQRDLGTELGARQSWGKASSPLAVDGLVLVSGGGRGGALVALDAATGATAWKAGSDRPGYASPSLVTLAGAPQVLAFNAGSVAGHDPASGRLLWSLPWESGQPTVAQPLVVDSDSVIVSSGYGRGAKRLRVRHDNGQELTAEYVWASLRLKAKFASFVLHAGYVYGLDDGVLTCIDPADGSRVWKQGRYGHGQLLLAGDLVLLVAEDGDLVLVEPTPEEHRELARVAALTTKTWNVPALSGTLLLLRNDREALALDLPQP